MDLDLDKALNLLSPMERNILYLRYGLDNGSPKTLEDIGAEYGITRERIRQLEAKALRKLRQPDMVRIIIKHVDSLPVQDEEAEHNNNTNDNNKQHRVDGL